MADPTYYLDINGLSKHFGEPSNVPDYAYNERNPGFGLTYESPKNKWIRGAQVGGYKNSFNDPSYYLAGSLARRFGNKYYADLGGFAGIATGYDKAKATVNGKEYDFTDPYKKITPMAGLLANAGIKDKARLGVKYVPGKKGLLMMNVGIPFK